MEEKSEISPAVSYRDEEIQKASAVESQHSRPDFIAQVINKSSGPEDFKEFSVQEAFNITNRANIDLGLMNREDYWSLKSVRDKFESRDEFDQLYDRVDASKQLMDAVRFDLNQVMLQGENPYKGDDSKNFFKNRAIESMHLASLAESGYAQDEDLVVGITGSPDKVLTNKKLAQFQGVETPKGYIDSPGLLEQLSSTDLWRVARDQEGIPKTTLSGNPYIERMGGSTEVTSQDQLVNIFSSGALENTFLDNNVIHQNSLAVLAQQVPRFLPVLKILPFAMDAMTGTAEFAKTVADFATQDKESSLKNSLNTFQNYLKKMGLDRDQSSQQSFFNTNNIISSVGDTYSQVRGMAGLAKLPAYVMGLRSAQKGGYQGLKLFKESLDTFVKTKNLKNAADVASKAYKMTGSFADDFYSSAASEQSKAIASKIGSVLGRGGMSMMATEDFAQTAKENGLSANEAMLMHAGFFAFMHTGPSLLTERVTQHVEREYGAALNKKLFKIYVKNTTGRGASGQVTEEASKQAMINQGGKLALAYKNGIQKLAQIYRSSGEAGVVGYLGSALNEGTEEVLELGGETGIKWMFNQVNSEKKPGIGRFQDVDWGQFAREAAFSGAMGALGGAVARGVFGSNAKRKAVALTDDTMIRYMVNASLDPEREASIEKSLEEAPEGTFGDASLSYAKDLDGKYRRKDASSPDSLLSSSQDQVVKTAFRTVWQNIKAVRDQTIARAQQEAGGDRAEFEKKWDTKAQEAFGDKLSLRLSKAQDEMADQISLIVRHENEIATLQESKTREGLAEEDKTRIEESINGLKEKVNQANGKVSEIIQGQVANKHYENAVYDLFSEANIRQDGTRAVEGDSDYMDYREWAETRKKVLEDVTLLQQEEDRRLMESRDFVEGILSDPSDGMEQMAEKMKLSPELSPEDAARLRDFINLQYDQELTEDHPVFKKIMDRAEADNFSQSAIRELRRELLGVPGEPAIPATATTQAVAQKPRIPGIKMGRLSGFEFMREDDSLEEVVYQMDYDSFRDDELDALVRGLNLAKNAADSIPEFTPLFDDKKVQDQARKRSEALLGIASSQELFNAVKQAASKGKLHRSPELIRHINQTITSTPDYSKETGRGTSKEDLLSQLSPLIRWVNPTDNRSQALFHALNHDFKAGSKSYTMQVKEQYEELLRKGPKEFVADIDNLKRLRDDIVRRRTFLKGLTTVDRLTAEFQALNQDYFRFKTPIETVFSPKASGILAKLLAKGISHVEKERLLKDFQDELFAAESIFGSWINQAAQDLETLNRLILFAESNKAASTEGIMLSDMKYMKRDAEFLASIVLDVFDPVPDTEEARVYEQLMDKILEIQNVPDTDVKNHEKKRLLLKEAELQFNAYFRSFPPSVQAQMRMKPGISTPDEKMKYNYFLTISRESFKNIHHKYNKAIAELNLESSPSYEQERAAIQMAVKFLDVNPLMMPDPRHKPLPDVPQRMVPADALRSRSMDNNYRDYLDSIGFIQGVGGSGKTTYIAAVVKMMQGNESVLVSALGKEQYDTMTANMEKLNIKMEKPALDSRGNFSIDLLIQNLTDKSASIGNPDLVIIDEITQLNKEELRKLDKAVKVFNEGRAKKLFVLGLGDPLQISNASQTSSGEWIIDSINEMESVERTPVIETSQRTGYGPNAELFRALRDIINNRNFDWKNPGSLSLNHDIENGSDVGVQVFNPSRDNWEELVRARIARASENKEGITYITTRSESELSFLPREYVKVVSPENAQGYEYDQVIVDIPGFKIEMNATITKMRTQLLYTAVTRTRKGLLIHDTGNWEVKSSKGIVSRVDSKLDPLAYKQYKEYNQKLINQFMELEKKYMGMPVVNTTTAWESLTSFDKLQDIVQKAFESYQNAQKDQGIEKEQEAYAQEFKRLLDERILFVMQMLEPLEQESKRPYFDDEFEADAASFGILSHFDREELASAIGLDSNAGRRGNDMMPLVTQDMLDQITLLRDSGQMDDQDYQKLKQSLEKIKNLVEQTTKC